MNPQLYRLATAFFVVLMSTNAAAQESAGDDEARARFSAGVIAYEAARYEEALADFQGAYELSGRAELLYNVGLSAERLRRDELAVESFERFLELRPDHEHAETVRTRLALLQRVNEDDVEGDGTESADTESADTESADTESADTEGPSRAGPWALGLAGGGMLVGGSVLLAIALADRAEIEGLTMQRAWPDIEAQVASVPRRSGAGLALIAVGGAAVVGAILWRVLTPNSPVNVAVGLGRVQLNGAF